MQALTTTCIWLVILIHSIIYILSQFLVILSTSFLSLTHPLTLTRFSHLFANYHCDWDCIHTINVTENNILNFIAWFLVESTLNSEKVSKTITSIGSWLKENGVSFIRKDFPTIKRAIDGYHNQRPPVIRRKKPFCHIHCALMFKYIDVLLISWRPPRWFY